MSRPPSNASLPRRPPSTNITRDDDAGLSQSLNQLSLSSQRGPRSPNLSSTPLKPPSRHASPSPRRPPSRSPSSHGRDSRAGTPPLIRKASMNSLHSANGIGPGRSVSRRSSLGQAMSPSRSTFGGPPPEPESPPLTANSVANSYFKAELEAHHGPVSTIHTETVVVLHDAVYGHRFSRPRTSKSALSTIVERPERIRAAVLGVSTAYVRLGERHSEGAFPIHPKRNMKSLSSIPFRIHKATRRVSLSSPAVTNVHGVKWMEELKMMCESAESVLAKGGKELQRPAINRGPDHAPPTKLHEGDLYLCAESLEAMEGALGAVCEAVDTVFSAGPRRAFVVVRPPGHHCSASLPSGFCWVNNVHVGIMHGILNHGLTHAAIIDFDLHHGDGSQAIAWAHNSRAAASAKNASPWKKTSIGYFSLHDINSYPCEMGDEEKVKNASICIDNAHGQTVWNVHLQSWKSEQEFWDVYETKYTVLLEKTRSYLKAQAERLKEAKQEPRAAIFLSAGFDASEWESAGMQRHQVNVPTEFYARLTRDITRLAAEEGLCVDGRIVSVLEGGYSDRALTSGVMSHLSGLVGGNRPHHTFNSLQEHNGLAFEMCHKIGAVNEDEPPTPQSFDANDAYDPSWWSSSELERLESTISRPESPVRKPRHTTPPTYCSPTQASTARAAEPLKMRRSLSGLASRATSRPPSPPPPEVPWMIAAHELSKLLIPADRQTKSCTHEDLNAEATRQRQHRQSLDLSAVSDAVDRPTSRMSLRERKPRAIGPIHEESSQLLKNRRKTVATSVVSTEKVTSRGNPLQPTVTDPVKRTTRRLSGSSIAHNSDSAASSTASNEEKQRRSATSGNSRPTSATSNSTQGASKITVRKTRPTSATRKEVAPKTPPGGRKSISPARVAPATTRSDSSVDDLDKITKGMKKIKINLITQSQKEAREKARLEAQKPPSPQADASVTGRLVASPELETMSQHSVGGAPVDTTAQIVSPEAGPRAGSGLSTPVLEHSSSRTVSPEVRQATPHANSPSVPHVAVQPIDKPGDFFIPYQPDGPVPITISPKDPLKWLPPNLPSPSANTPVATPSPVKKQNNLYHHTPGGIPFAPRPPQSVPQPGQPPVKKSPPPKPPKPSFTKKLSGSSWEVPEAQQK